jgi:hypothetical protein
MWWYMPVISTALEEERDQDFKASPGKGSYSLSQNGKRAGGVAEEAECFLSVCLLGSIPALEKKRKSNGQGQRPQGEQ